MPRFSHTYRKLIHMCRIWNVVRHLIHVNCELWCLQVVRSLITLETRKSTQFHLGNMERQELFANLKGNSQHHPFKVIRLYNFLTVAPLMSPCHTWNKMQYKTFVVPTRSFLPHFSAILFLIHCPPTILWSYLLIAIQPYTTRNVSVE